MPVKGGRSLIHSIVLCSPDNLSIPWQRSAQASELMAVNNSPLLISVYCSLEAGDLFFFRSFLMHFVQNFRRYFCIRRSSRRLWSRCWEVEGMRDRGSCLLSQIKALRDVACARKAFGCFPPPAFGRPLGCWVQYWIRVERHLLHAPLWRVSEAVVDTPLGFLLC